MFTKAPFIRIVIPLIVGILAHYFLHINAWSVWLVASGLTLMILSFLLPQNLRYKGRWLFGFGTTLFVIALGSITTSIQQRAVSCNFSDHSTSYKAVIIDAPQIKPHSIALKLKLLESGKKVLANVQASVLSEALKCGDVIFFNSKIQAFSNLGNPEEFDYASYMTNNGFSGTTYLPANKWDTADETLLSPSIEALRCRQRVLDFYKSLDLNDKEFSILSALTLGYKNSLSDDLKLSFRATGTAHILAVSGLHVGIIFALISLLFLPFGQKPKVLIFSQTSLILLLWGYAFFTGLSPSVIRACVMLSLFCLSRLFGRQFFSYNSIAFAAFVMLLINPLWLFDISFQYSFVAVLSILLLQPYAARIAPKNKYLKYFWNIFAISCIAQLGTFAISLYYFGTYPNYFFIANLLVIPLVGLILYAALSLIFLLPLALFFPHFKAIFYFLPKQIVHYAISGMTFVVEFFEKMPFAYIQNLKISSLTLFILYAIILLIIYAFMRRRPNYLKLALSTVLIFIVVHLPERINPKNQLIVFNRPKHIDVQWNIGRQKFSMDTLVDYQFVDLQGKRFLALKHGLWQAQNNGSRFMLDYLYIASNKNSLESLSQCFVIKNVILDASLSDRRRQMILAEGRNLNIPCYDMKEHGAFQIAF